MARGLLSPWFAMIKLTRLQNQVVVVNPDHIYEAEARPDTTLRLVNGDTMIVKETLDELIAKVVEYRQRIRGDHDAGAVATVTIRHRHDDDDDGGVR
jgi:flagellar protein FlbD